MAQNSHLSPGTGLWHPGMKPGPPHAIEFDPAGEMSVNLKSILLFENSQPSGSGPNNLPMGTRDYVNPSFCLFSNDTTNTTILSPYGGLAAKTPGTSTGAWIFWSKSGGTTATNITAASAVWSASFRSKYDGIGGATYTGNLIPFCNAAQTEGIGVASGNNEFTDFTSSAFLATPVITNLTTWHRLTFTSDGTTLKVYQDGILSSSVALTVNFALGVVCNGWPWPMDDFFFWSRTLTALEVQIHNADPYGTTMRPVGAGEAEWKGTVAAGAGVKPGLLLLGVGP